MALNQDTTVGLPYNTGGTLALNTTGATADGVFIIDIDGEIWERIFDGGNSVFRASWLFNNGAAADKTSLVNIALAASAIGTLEIDVPITLNGSVAAAGKTIVVQPGGLISGTGTIDNVVLSGDATQQLAATTLTFTNAKNATGKWLPAQFGATGDGVTDDYTAINFTNTVANANSQKIINLLPGTYNIGTNLAISSGVLLDFEHGAIIDGAITLSGSSAQWSAEPAQKVFGSSITVSGIYPQSGTVSPMNFGAVGDNATNDGANINRMFSYVLTIPNNLINVVFPPKRYYVSESIIIPNIVTPGITINISGYGCTIRTDQDIPIWYRMPTDNTEANQLITTIFKVAGFRITGNSTYGAPKTNQVGMRFGALYTSVFDDLQFESIYDGLELLFALGCELNNIRVTNQTNIGISGRYGTWSGATASNSSFNGNMITNCRVYNLDGAFTSLSLLGADQILVDNFISEGKNPQYNIYYNYNGNTTVLSNTFSNIWLESTAGTHYPRNTNFYLRIQSQIFLQNIQRDYDNYLFELDGAAGGWQLQIDGLPYFLATPPALNFTGNTDGYIILKNTKSSLDSIFRDSTYWDSGNIANFVFEGRTSSVYDSDVVTGLKTYKYTTSYIDSGGSNVARTYSTTATVPTLTLTNPASISTVRSLIRGYLYNTGTHANLLTGLVTFFSDSASADDRTKGYVITNVGAASLNHGTLVFCRAKGTTIVPTSVANNDYLGGIIAQGYTSNMYTGAKMFFQVDGTPSGTTVPTRYRLYLVNSGGTTTEVFGIRATGQLEIPVAPNAGALTDGIMTITSAGLVRQVATTALVASGTQYQLAYYAATGQAVSGLTAITASRALKSDVNGLPVAFDTATEPSLTELTYVKGVTSAIQTQLNSKIASASIVSGLYAANGDGILTTFTVTHGYTGTPTNVQVTPAGVDSAVLFFVNNITGTTFDVTFTTPPITGTNNVTFYWVAK